MGDPLQEAFLKSFEFVVAGAVAVIGWVIKRTINRVDLTETEIRQIREEYVKKKEHLENINALRAEIRQQHQQIIDQIDKASHHQTALIEKTFNTLDRQAGRIDDLHNILLARADERIAREAREAAKDK